MTDVATGFTVNRSVPNKAAVFVTEAIEQPKASSPSRSSASTQTMGQSSSTPTCSTTAPPARSPSPELRPGNKNDGAHVEQKNWTHVRELVGYLRFDTASELELLNSVHACLAEPPKDSSPMTRSRPLPIGPREPSVPADV